MKLHEAVIVSACRTPIGKFQGQFAAVPARDLAITAASEAIRRAGIAAEVIDEIVMGQLYTAMQGSLPARQVAMRVGMAPRSNAVSVNQNCASGMRALEIACHNIQLGKTDVGLVVGVESMSNIPYLLPRARGGMRMGDGALVDGMLHDGLVDELAGGHMGTTADNVAKRYGITREECDALAVQSHKRACAAIDNGSFREEIVPVTVQGRGGPQLVDTDEHPVRGCSMEALSQMRPGFRPDGVTTAGNASGINDAAAAVIVMSRERAAALGLEPLVKMIHICGEGVDPKYMGLGPARAIPKCLKAAGLRFDDIDYWEINEAFAAQFLGVARMLKEEQGIVLPMDRVNVNGSGISLGHPVGCTALRIVVTMLYEMRRSGFRTGGASLCVGSGPSLCSLWTRDI